MLQQKKICPVIVRSKPDNSTGGQGNKNCLCCLGGTDGILPRSAINHRKTSQLLVFVSLWT